MERAAFSAGLMQGTSLCITASREPPTDITSSRVSMEVELRGCSWLNFREHVDFTLGGKAATEPDPHRKPGLQGCSQERAAVFRLPNHFEEEEV